jgi:hypothetical protein
MFVAPLNLDLFFKKVFSNKRIAKSFLQDLLGKRISEITLLRTDHKLSDDAVIVKFDFRCKIDGAYIQIEMQQKYKRDVNKRFYLYHCVNTAVQLETLTPIVITKPNGDTYTEKDYSGIEPVITIIWMVDDNLNFKDDMIVFSTLPETATNFIKDENLWSKPIENILEQREKILKILNNTTKDLGFFAQNRLIYLFQNNIIQNKLMATYFKWFDFAQKSRNPNNVEEDFSQFKEDKIMAEVLRRLQKNKLEPQEFKYVSDLEQYAFYYEIMLAKKEKEIQLKIAKIEKKEQRKVEAEQRKVAEKEKQLLSAVKAFLALGKDVSYIADILSLPIEEAQELVNKIPK